MDDLGSCCVLLQGVEEKAWLGHFLRANRPSVSALDVWLRRQNAARDRSVEAVRRASEGINRRQGILNFLGQRFSRMEVCTSFRRL